MPFSQQSGRTPDVSQSINMVKSREECNIYLCFGWWHGHKTVISRRCQLQKQVKCWVVLLKDHGHTNLKIMLVFIYRLEIVYALEWIVTDPPWKSWQFAPVIHGAIGCSPKDFKLVWWCHQPLSRFLANYHLPQVSANDKGDNEMIPGTVHRSPGICLRAEENPGKRQLGGDLSINN